MKILAIRGRNLASLAGNFELDFTKAPLADAGLFAVTGPTGAGKSTLLDALCVALYNRTPRLENRGGVALGLEGSPDKDLGAGDVRFLLRRGEAEGFAEVDVRVADGRVYRTRWEARRARGNVGGALQKVGRFLWRLDDGQPVRVAEGISGVAEQLPELIGLDFEQFRRSALLAQGDFAALLKAKPDERADLLERMTNTRIYADLSRAAYERVRDHLADVKQMSDQATALEAEVLPPAPRAAREAELQQANDRTAGLRCDRDALAEARRWWETLEGLAGAAQEAAGALTGAEEADAAAEGRRAWLALVEAAEELRPLVAAVDRQSTARNIERDELTARQGQANVAAGALRSAEGALTAATERYRVAVTARDEARPALAEARELDGQVRTARDEAREAQAEATRRVLQSRSDTSIVQELEGQIARTLAARDEASTWLAGRAWLEPVAGEWTRWTDALGRLVRLRTDRDALALELSGTRALACDDGARAEEARRVYEVARDDRLAREQALAARQKELEAVDGGALQEGLQRQSVSHRLVAEGLGVARDLLGARESLSEAEREAVVAQERGAQIGATALELASRADLALAAEDEAARALAEARTALSLDGHRAHLAEGQPCPLCGSTEHPWAVAAPAFDDFTRSQGERLAGLRAERERLQAEATRLGKEAAGHAARAAELERQAARLGPTLEAQQERWRRLVSQAAEVVRALPTWPEAPDGTTAPAFERILVALDAEIGATNDQLKALSEGQRQVAEGQREAKTASARVEGLRDAADKAAGAAQAAALAVEGRQHTLDRSNAEVGEAEAALGPLAALCPVGSASPTDSPGIWQSETGALLERWRGERATVDRLDGEATALGVKRETAAAVADGSNRLAGEADRLARKREAALEGLIARRASLLAGREADSAEADLDRAVSRAEGARSEASAKRDEVALALRSAQTKVSESEDRIARLERELGEARAALDARLVAHAIDEPEVRRRLEPDAAWRAGERAALQELVQAVGRARTLVDERSRRLKRHGEQPQPAWPAAECDARLEGIGLAIESAEAAAVDLQKALAIDADKRARGEALRVEIATREVGLGVWKQLNDLIGSHDGKRFKVFAQGLTFEALLAHANRHLVDLAPRYSLRRAPGSDLDLQVVDHDLADEVRPSTGLSGGESFLVSLALALGLSGLAARDTRIESLFIDEGFGTLDPDTLEAALAALDALQSAGRTVGIISHVPGLAERLGVKVSVTPEGAGRSSIHVG